MLCAQIYLQALLHFRSSRWASGFFLVGGGGAGSRFGVVTLNARTSLFWMADNPLARFKRSKRTRVVFTICFYDVRGVAPCTCAARFSPAQTHEQTEASWLRGESAIWSDL